MGVFPLGVASFDPSTDAVVLWTWVTDDIDQVTWEVALDAEFTQVVRSGAVTRPTGVVRVDLEGLEPGTDHHYRFRADGSVACGLTRTLPVATGRVRLGVVCCALLERRGFEAYERVAERGPDLVVHLGDYIYERSDENSPTCRTADDYRARYGQYRDDQSLQDLHAAAPWVTVWDDHEIGDGSWRRGSSRDVGKPAEFAERRRAARVAYDEFLPQRVDEGGPTHLDRHVRFGNVLDVVVLDARNAGREEPVRPTGGPGLVDDDDDRQILTEDQWTWLEECVADAPGWLILATQTQVAPLRLAQLPDRRRPWRTLPLVNAGQWDGYPVERRRLGSLLAPIAERTVILSGDLHGRFWTGVATPDGRRIPELTIPSVASVPFAEAIRRTVPLVPTAWLSRWLAWLNPHIESMDLTGRGAAIVDVTPDRLDIEVVDPDGITTFRTTLTR